MALIRIHEKPNAVPVNASVFVLETQVNGVWYTLKVTWEQLKGLIGALDNLENYYKKSETYTKTEVNQLIAQIPTFSIEIVQQLPTTDISTTTIYLVPKQTAGTLDYYDEFINLDGTTSGWEWLGKTEIDLSNYYTKAETEAYVKGDGADYIAGTKTFSTLTTTVQNILGAINEVDSHADAAQADATQALSDASTAQGTANSASAAASTAQGTADNALTAAGNAASAAAAAQQTANTAQTTANNMAISITNTLTPTSTTQKLADVTQNSTTTSIYGDDATKVAVALTDEQTTTPGNPVTLTTEQSGGAKSAVVTFTPKQSGTGDPSPENVRPISGWDGVSLATRQNYYTTIGYAQGAINTSTGGDATARNDRLRTSGYNTVEANKQYGLYITANKEIEYTAYFYKTDGTYIEYNGGWIANKSSFTTPTNTGRVRFAFRFADESNISASDMSVNYLQETTAATFGSTIYGGSYDFVSGKGSETWEYIAQYNGETITEPWISSIDVYTPGATPSTGAEVAYKLATTTEITLTPEDIELLKGTNTVWSNANGTVTVGYSKLPNGNLGAVVDYIKKLEARVKALET